MMYSLTAKYGEHPVSATMMTDPQACGPENNFLQAKEGLVNGVFKTFKFKNNIHCLCSAYFPREDFHLHKSPLSTEFFVLRVDGALDAFDIVKTAGGKHSNELNAFCQSVLLMSSLEEFTFFAPKNSTIKTLEILMPRIWFFSQLNMECSYGLLKKYMAVKTKKPKIGCSDDFFKKLFLTIVDEANRETYNPDDLENKVSLLLKIFFTDLSASLHDFLESEKIKISKDEINRLMNVRKYLDTNLPSPTFTSLTKIALMSGTSLKTKFKKMYGSTVFEYFQRMRMERARILLLTHKYSVKQIGRLLGYSNLSNFTIAFKKEFNQLPHELLK